MRTVPNSLPRPRFPVLDAWRSVAVALMLAYHFLYDLAIFGVLPWDSLFCTPLNVLERFICSSFILLAGASARFSRNNLRRGLIVLVSGAVVEAGAAVAGQTIRFGVLMLLGCGMVLYHFTGGFLEKLPRWGLSAGCGALFFLSWRWTRSVSVPVPWLYPIGLTSPGFHSADYFPLLPWLFLFLIGTAFGGWCLDHPDSHLLTAPLPKPLTYLGRHSLLIYLLHQPVLYGITYLIWG